MAKEGELVFGEETRRRLEGRYGRENVHAEGDGKPEKNRRDKKRGQRPARVENTSLPAQEVKMEEPVVQKKNAVATTATQANPQRSQPTRPAVAPAPAARPQNVRPATATVQQLAHPNDSQSMKMVLNLVILPPMKVDGQNNPAFRAARDTLRNAMNAVDPGDLGRKVNLFTQRIISGTARPEEISAMFGIYTAQGRRWQAHDVLAVQKAVAAIKASRPALTALFTETFSAPTREGPQTRNLAHQVPNTTYVSYAYGKEALPAYLGILKANGLASAAAELERHIGESNMRAVLAQQRKVAAKTTETAEN